MDALCLLWQSAVVEVAVRRLAAAVLGVALLVGTILGVALLLGTMGAERSTPSRPAGSKQSSSLVFEGAAGVYALGADGRGLRLVARDAWAPQWSANGKSMAFLRFTRPYHLDLSTGRTQPFPPEDANYFALSPDGARIAFWDDGGGGFAIFVAHLDGHGAKRLTAGPDDLNPAWSPDGTAIAFEQGSDPSRAGTRTVPIPGVLRGHLLAHHLRHGRPTTGLVFGRTSTQPFSPSSLRLRALSAWRNATGGPLTPIELHECRHTFASLMIAAGVNAKALSTYLGHSSIQITLDRYGHLMPGNEQEAARLLDRYLDADGATG